jgi:hypothetical protein
MAFRNRSHGMLAGRTSLPVEDPSELPPDVQSDRKLLKRVRETRTLLMETNDGGNTWSAWLLHVCGEPFRLAAHGFHAALLLRDENSIEYPSWALASDTTSRSTSVLFRRRNLEISDVNLDDRGVWIVAPKPRATNDAKRPRIFHSPDYSAWTKMKVDYRAQGNSARFATSGSGRRWIAVGDMILHLAE